MNTNNKEALKEIKHVVGILKAWGVESDGGILGNLNRAVSLLQDNEVKEGTISGKAGVVGSIYGVEIAHSSNVGDDREHDPHYLDCWCNQETPSKPSSKVEKLNRLMVDVEQGENLREAMIRLIELIEDEE